MNLLLLFDLAAKSAGILLLAFAVQSLWRRASAAQRCVVWFAAFAALLLLPLTLLIQPQWTLLRRVPAAPAPITPLEVNFAAFAEAPLAPHAELPKPTTWRPRLSPLQAVGAVWLAGVFLLLGHRWLGSWRLRRLRSQSASCSVARIVQPVADLSRSLGIRRRVEIRTTSSITVPVTWGVLNPVILVPRAAQDWSEEALSAALLHELAHIRHWDAATRWLATLACALHWWNPLAWLAAGAWRAAQEQAADDVVLRSGASAQDYALQLLQAARSFQQTGLLRAPLLAMARPATLEARLSAIMDAKRNRRRLDRRGLWMAVLGTVVFLGGLSSLRLQGEPAKAQPSPTAANFIPTPGEKLIAVEVKVLEAPSTRLTKDPRIVSGKVISAREANLLAQDLLKESEVKVSAYPRMLTRDRLELMCRSVVNYPLPNGQPPLAIGTVIKLLPSISGEKVNIDADISFSRNIGEENAFPVVSTRTLNTSAEIPPGHAIIWALKSEDNHPDQIFLLTPSIIVASQTATVPDARQLAAKIILPHIQLAGTSVDEAVEFLRVKSRTSGVEGAENLNITVQGKSPPALLTLDLKDIPLDESLRYVAGLSDLELRFEGNSIILAPPGTPAIPAPTLAPKPATAKTPSPVEQKAASIILPSVQFSEATFDEAVEYFRVKSRQIDPQKAGVNIVVPPGPTTVSLNLALQNVPLSTALHYVAQLSNLDLRYQENAVILTRRENSQASLPDSGLTPASRAVAKAKAIILPSVVFSGASLTEAVEYLRIKGREFAPDKQGINIIISQPPNGIAAVINGRVITRAEVQGATPGITYDLRQISLLQALQTAATQAEFTVQADDEALILVPVKK